MRTGERSQMEFKLNDYHRNVSDEELLQDLKKVARELKKDSITTEEYNKKGKYCKDTISRRFGKWTDALRRAGLTPSGKQVNVIGICLDDMIVDLQDVSDKLKKRTFTSNEYEQYGKYSKDIFFRKFGSWNEALKAAGLDPFDHPLGGGKKNKVSEYSCLEEIERLWVELGRQPTTADIKNGISKYSLHTYERRFGSWRKALEFFVDYMNGIKDVDSSNNCDETEMKPERVQSSENITVTHRTKRDINLRMRFSVMKRDNFKCCLCGRTPATTPGLELQIDHIIPWSKGGETVIENLQTLCSDCNIGKSNL